MSKSNGLNKEAEVGIEDKATENTKRRSSYLPNNTLEEGFRGFEKVPYVILQRYDITPYINNKTNDKKINGVLDQVSVHVKRLSQKCIVNIPKQDLDELKKSFQLHRDRQISTESVTDGETNTMADIKCKICEKAYSSQKKLLKHQENKHMIVYKPHSKPQKRVSFSDHVIVHEVKEYHKCRKCPKIFEAYKLLKLHMKLQHKKRKCYICNYCNKKFVDRTFFKLHIKLHCDMCGLLLKNKLQFNLHKRDVCRNLKRLKCNVCKEIYFKFMDLKDHSYEHICECYACDICKDQFVSKCAVGHHIAFLHSNVRPTCLYAMRNLGNERLYLCNFCDESSVERDLIENHVQLLPDLSNKAMTGYKDYYFCDQCMKKFDTETNMLQHKWTHFLKTSDNSQIRVKYNKKKLKTTYRNGEVIPEFLKPKVVLEKLKVGGKVVTDAVEFIDVKSFDINNGEIEKAVVHPKSKKTIISKHQCQTCGKYYSSGYCLNRHIETQHSDYDNLRCKVCEETFVWPSLLKSHKCIRLSYPEMPFEDARPEIHFENLHEIGQNGFDDFNIDDDDNYMQSVDFEIPAPIVQLTEYDTLSSNTQDKFASLSNLGYKLVMQEVPIEF